jgi:peptide chain release factor 2
MEAPDFWDNNDKAQKTIQSLKPLNGLLKPYEELSAAVGDLGAMAELADEDPAFEAELEGALARAEPQMESFELKAMLNGPQDASNAFLRIQAGAGGTDACDWAAMLLRMYTRWAEDHGYTVEEQDVEPNIEAGLHSAQIRVVGDYAYGYLAGETGVHRLVRMSPFGSGDTRQTSFAAVDVTPELDDNIDIQIVESELVVQTFASGGPGGQHQNKTQSGVRIIHPSGVRAESRAGRSQHKNYDIALALLKARLYAIEEKKRLAEVEQAYDSKGEVAWGNQMRNYVLQPYTLAKDVRTGIETSQVNKVLDGDLDPFLEAYLRLKAQRANKKK